MRTEAEADGGVIAGFTGAYRVFDPADPYPVTEGDGVVYPTLWHAYYGIQARWANDRRFIAAAPSVEKARKMGSLVRLHQPQFTWPRYRSWLMWHLYRRKFADVGYQTLLGTGDAALVYVNTLHEQDWGDCRCVRDDCREPGADRLGAMLMQMRAKTRKLLAEAQR